MPIGNIIVEFEIAHAQSLKDRRQAVRSIKERLRRSFNVSVAELDEVVVWNRVSLGIVSISASSPYLSGQLIEVERACHRFGASVGAEVIDLSAEMLEV